MFRRHEVRMFADPAQPRLFGPGLFHDRSGINVGSGDCLRGQCGDSLFQLLEFRTEHVVIVPAPGIAGNAAMARPFVGAFVGQIVYADANDGATVR